MPDNPIADPVPMRPVQHPESREAFRSELIAWVTGSAFASVVVLAGAKDEERTDAQLTGYACDLAVMCILILNDGSSCCLMLGPSSGHQSGTSPQPCGSTCPAHSSSRTLTVAMELMMPRCSSRVCWCHVWLLFNHAYRRRHCEDSASGTEAGAATLPCNVTPT